ncbi:MAG: MerR family transcriptional regulator [Gordonia sp. (in: high G+C Gram-positive bacteria)]|uniref:MerR family transcriptional regulator n=1 Tax=Gordonia sp. (in: high G+C Gram-positive bacteria) TaxID=84139 RepID=UPI0039E49375
MTEYRIDDLARAAGTTTRNVRGYQDRGLIPKPVRRGRIAIYNDQHFERLKVINDLLGRGFTMAHISEFLDGIERGDGLAEVLGLQELVRSPLEETPTETISRQTFYDRLGTDDPDVIRRILTLGLVEPVGDADPPAEYLIKDTETVGALYDLMEIGVPASVLIDLQEKLDAELLVAARTLVTGGRRMITEGRFDGWIPESDEESDWAAEFIRRLRATGRVTAHNSFNRILVDEMNRQLDDYLAVARKRRHDSVAD